MFWPGLAEVQRWAHSALESWDVGWQLGMVVQIKTTSGRRSWHLPMVFQLLSGHKKALPGLKCPFKLYGEVWEWRRMGISVLSSRIAQL